MLCYVTIVQTYMHALLFYFEVLIMKACNCFIHSHALSRLHERKSKRFEEIIFYIISSKTMHPFAGGKVSN